MVRTTAVLEETLFKKIKRLSFENQKTFKETVTELIQIGLNQKKSNLF